MTAILVMHYIEFQRRGFGHTDKVGSEMPVNFRSGAGSNKRPLQPSSKLKKVMLLRKPKIICMSKATKAEALKWRIKRWI